MSIKILIKSGPTAKPVSVEPEVDHQGPYGYVILGPVVIGGVPAAQLAIQLRNLANQLDPVMGWSARVETITEAEVVEHFEQSPHLQQYAPDVRYTLGQEMRQDTPGTFGRAISDYQAISDLKNPSQADIAERLFGDRTLTGGAYRRRILAALELLQKLTTTNNNGQNSTTTAFNQVA